MMSVVNLIFGELQYDDEKKNLLVVELDTMQVVELDIKIQGLYFLRENKF